MATRPTTAVPSPASARHRTRGLPPAALPLLADAARLLERRDLSGAARALIGVLALAPAHPEALRLEGLLLHRQGRLPEAAARYALALEAWPDDAPLLTQAGALKADLGEVDEAHALLRRACEAAPAFAEAWLRLALLFDRQAAHAEALGAARRLAALAPDHREAGLLIARNLQALGRIDEAAAEYRRLIARGGAEAYPAWFSLVDLKTVRLAPAEAAALERLHGDERLPESARAALGFALGRVQEDAGRYVEAFATLGEANARIRRSLQWDAAASTREIDALLGVFSALSSASAAPIGAEVIFVVGMPRSSTTLVEQILAAHPEVTGASELPDLPAVIAAESKRTGRTLAEWAPRASAADWERLGRDYLARTARWRRERPRFTDKLPGNWLLVGAIRAMLPAAVVIDCRRDAMETCWSCYKQLFAPGVARYAYDLRELGMHWRNYDRVMRTWATQHAGRVHVQSHARLVEDSSEQIRALADFCRLPFDDRLLRFQDAERGVRSASAAQVRRPLAAPVLLAERYGPLLAPLRQTLGLPLPGA